MTQSSLDLEELAEQSECDQNTLYKIPKELIRNKYMIRGKMIMRNDCSISVSQRGYMSLHILYWKLQIYYYSI